ncbi:unnamed protein product [Discosporangium mesarthrocarpum]
MGPVLAFTFGTNVRDPDLTRQGFVVEFLSLLTCVAVGFVTTFLGISFVEEGDWPTDEMLSRGKKWNLLVGLAIAIPSGFGVALSVLSKNANSLVGVAISASLLPPAVNSGMCWGFALIGPATKGYFVDVENFVEIGLVSLLLTLVNILSIYLAGVLLFRIKEVAPIVSGNSFWSKDMIQARKFQQRLEKYRSKAGGQAANHLRQGLLDVANKVVPTMEGPVPAAVYGSPAAAAQNLETLSGAPINNLRQNMLTFPRYSESRIRHPTVLEVFGQDANSHPFPTQLGARPTSFGGPAAFGGAGNGTGPMSGTAGGAPPLNAIGGGRRGVRRPSFEPELPSEVVDGLVEEIAVDAAVRGAPVNANTVSQLFGDEFEREDWLSGSERRPRSWGSGASGVGAWIASNLFRVSYRERTRSEEPGGS